jgi:hypothetical protein
MIPLDGGHSREKSQPPKEVEEMGRFKILIER